MDKRKIKTTKSSDGKTKITRNKFGSSYKNSSKLQTVVTDISEIPLDEQKDIFNDINLSYDVQHMISNYEKGIKNFISSLDLDIDIEDQWLVGTLKKDYLDHKGVIQAANCLFEIQCCRNYFRGEKYKEACANLARLVDAYNKFFFAISEATLSIGKHRTESFINKNTKLTEHQYEESFIYLESLESEITGHGCKGRRVKKTIKYIDETFNITLNERTIRDKYKVWKSR